MIQVKTHRSDKFRVKRGAFKRFIRSVLIQVFAWSVLSAGLFVLWYILEHQATIFEPLRQALHNRGEIEPITPPSNETKPSTTTTDLPRNSKARDELAVIPASRDTIETRTNDNPAKRQSEISSNRNNSLDSRPRRQEPRPETQERGSAPIESAKPRPTTSNPPAPAEQLQKFLGADEKIDAKELQSQHANDLNIDPFRISEEQIEVALIPPGSFLQGLSDPEYEAQKKYFQVNEDTLAHARPTRLVILTKPFYISITEITKEQFSKFVSETGYTTDAEKAGEASVLIKGEWIMKKRISWRNPGFNQAGDHPVVCVSWNDAAAYCQWLSRKYDQEFRLPTEAEWEFACRSLTQTIYHFGDSHLDLGNFAWFATNSKLRTQKSKEKAPNEWGIYGMHGNAWEWCGDYFAAYGPGNLFDPTGPAKGTKRVVRGGGWDIDSHAAFSALRFPVEQGASASNGGFRIVWRPF